MATKWPNLPQPVHRGLSNLSDLSDCTDCSSSRGRFFDFVLRGTSKSFDLARVITIQRRDIKGIKESVFKIKNEKGISFPDHIFENTFLLSDKKTTSQLSFNNLIESFDIFFEVINSDNSQNYTLVYAFEN